MFRRSGSSAAQAYVEALDRSMAVIEFGLDGSILCANANFLALVGYGIEEIRGKPHRMLVEPGFAESAAYSEFWDGLRGGRFASGEFMRVNKAGDRLWLQATYTPVLDASGKPVRVVKYAADITAKKNEISRLLTMIDDMPAAVMPADPRDDFRIDYLNATSKKTLGSIEQHLPIKAAELLGSSIDVFHKNPAHQREMLKDARHLPHKAKIRVGPETLSLQVSAIHGPDGSYVGPMLTWAVVTAQETIAADVSRVVQAVTAAVAQMERSAEGLTRSADEARERATSVAASSDQMNGSIREIASQVGRVSDRAQQIATQAGASNSTVRRLAENARKVDAVVGMIKSVADQTNLLALNATIEAARAGAAGRGFAVVAAEVKALAGQTARATDEITHQVSAIQTATGEAVGAIEAITGAVSELSKLTLSMARAVEEQAASTQEMVTNIGGVSAAANTTGQLAGAVGAIATNLSDHSLALGKSVELFLKSS